MQRSRTTANNENARLREMVVLRPGCFDSICWRMPLRLCYNGGMTEQGGRAMEFVRLSLADASRVAALVADAFAAPPWSEVWPPERALVYAREGLDGGNMLGFALADGEQLAALVMGHVRHWHNRTEWILEDVCVGSAYQGQGHGGALLEMAVEAAQALGIDEIGLRTRRDAPAYHFYQKHGFMELEKDVYFSRKL